LLDNQPYFLALDGLLKPAGDELYVAIVADHGDRRDCIRAWRDPSQAGSTIWLLAGTGLETLPAWLRESVGRNAKVFEGSLVLNVIHSDRGIEYSRPRPPHALASGSPVRPTVVVALRPLACVRARSRRRCAHRVGKSGSIRRGLNSVRSGMLLLPAELSGQHAP
jgi:hypothetical protein